MTCQKGTISTQPKPQNMTFTPNFSLLVNLWGLPFKTIWILSCLGTVLASVLYALAGLYLATVDGYSETVSYCWIPSNKLVPLAIERVVSLAFKLAKNRQKRKSLRNWDVALRHLWVQMQHSMYQCSIFHLALQLLQHDPSLEIIYRHSKPWPNDEWTKIVGILGPWCNVTLRFIYD